MSSIIYDEIEIEDFDFDPEMKIFYYPCPCGDKFQISEVFLYFYLSLLTHAFYILRTN